ncbi:MAG TPA: 3-hydroxyacyl-CoA dehydrogenase NAD-binding domain-containing protein [Caulobacteraceae bacterium]
MTDLLSVSPDQAAAAKAYLDRAQQESWNVPDIGPEVKVLPVTSVGVIGAGTMGGGISMNFLNVGIPVTIVETTQAALDRGLGVIRKNYERSASRGRLTMEEVEQRMALLTPSLELGDLAGCDLTIEAVFENMQVKKDIFGRLDQLAKPGAILATNTSALNIDEIATATKRPEAVIGLHFFSPANVMKLLEIVRAEKTSKEVVATSLAVARKIGKVAAVVGVCPGFVGNRILFPRQQAAQALLLDGAMPWDVDRALTSFGFPMGPFAMSDLAGLDIGWSKENSKGETLRDILCEMDRRGQKTGAGYYDYDEERRAVPSPVVEKIVREFVAKKGGKPREVSQEEILERCLFPMVNEGAKILDEKMAIRASDIDVVWVNGYGWPVARGGPMYWADTVGPARIAARLKEMGAEVSPYLQRVADSSSHFTQ